MCLSCFQQGNFPSFFWKIRINGFLFCHSEIYLTSISPCPPHSQSCYCGSAQRSPEADLWKPFTKSSVGQVQLRKVPLRMVPLFPSCPLGVEKRFKEFTVLHSKELKFKTAAKHSEDNTRTSHSMGQVCPGRTNGNCPPYPSDGTSAHRELHEQAQRLQCLQPAAGMQSQAPAGFSASPLTPVSKLLPNLHVEMEQTHFHHSEESTAEQHEH